MVEKYRGFMWFNSHNNPLAGEGGLGVLKNSRIFQNRCKDSMGRHPNVMATRRSRLPKPQTVLLYLYASQQRALPPAFQTAFKPIRKSKSIARVDKWKT